MPHDSVKPGGDDGQRSDGGGAVVAVRHDERGVSLLRSDGAARRLLWDELTEVALETSDDGPVGEDVWWVLTSGDAGVRVPDGATGTAELLVRLQELPGFDNDALIEAMSCVERRTFVLWRASS